jgi:hypothetical protein
MEFKIRKASRHTQKLVRQMRFSPRYEPSQLVDLLLAGGTYPFIWARVGGSNFEYEANGWGLIRPRGSEGDFFSSFTISDNETGKSHRNLGYSQA